MTKMKPAHRQVKRLIELAREGAADVTRAATDYRRAGAELKARLYALEERARGLAADAGFNDLGLEGVPAVQFDLYEGALVNDAIEMIDRMAEHVERSIATLEEFGDADAGAA